MRGKDRADPNVTPADPQQLDSGLHGRRGPAHVDGNVDPASRRGLLHNGAKRGAVVIDTHAVCVAPKRSARRKRSATCRTRSPRWPLRRRPLPPRSAPACPPPARARRDRHTAPAYRMAAATVAVAQLAGQATASDNSGGTRKIAVPRGEVAIIGQPSAERMPIGDPLVTVLEQPLTLLRQPVAGRRSNSRNWPPRTR